MPVDMWTIGFADRLRLPRFAKQARKAGGARFAHHRPAQRPTKELMFMIRAAESPEA